MYFALIFFTHSLSTNPISFLNNMYDKYRSQTYNRQPIEFFEEISRKINEL
jgi:hypothetical protein